MDIFYGQYRQQPEFWRFLCSLRFTGIVFECKELIKSWSYHFVIHDIVYFGARALKCQRWYKQDDFTQAKPQQVTSGFSLDISYIICQRDWILIMYIFTYTLQSLLKGILGCVTVSILNTADREHKSWIIRTFLCWKYRFHGHLSTNVYECLHMIYEFKYLIEL